MSDYTVLALDSGVNGPAQTFPDVDGQQFVVLHVSPLSFYKDSQLLTMAEGYMPPAAGAEIILEKVVLP